MVVQINYKNHNASLASSGTPLLKRGAICATISGYFMVIGTFCCRSDFQYSLLN
jgi:hypothetical protein